MPVKCHPWISTMYALSNPLPCSIWVSLFRDWLFQQRIKTEDKSSFKEGGILTRFILSFSTPIYLNKRHINIDSEYFPPPVRIRRSLFLLSVNKLFTDQGEQLLIPDYPRFWMLCTNLCIWTPIKRLLDTLLMQDIILWSRHICTNALSIMLLDGKSLHPWQFSCLCRTSDHIDVLSQSLP